MDEKKYLRKRFYFWKKENLEREEKIPFKKVLIFSFVLGLLTIFSVILSLNRLPPEVPIFYGLPQGKEQLGPTSSLFLPGFLAIFLSLINTAIIFTLGDDFLKKTLVFTSLALNILCFIGTIKIVFLVGNF